MSTAKREIEKQLNDYDWVTEDMFSKKLEEIVGRLTTAQLMAMPGFVEIAREDLNNQVLEELDGERDTQEGYDHAMDKDD